MRLHFTGLLLCFFSFRSRGLETQRRRTTLRETERKLGDSESYTKHHCSESQLWCPHLVRHPYWLWLPEIPVYEESDKGTGKKEIVRYTKEDRRHLCSRCVDVDLGIVPVGNGTSMAGYTTRQSFLNDKKVRRFTYISTRHLPQNYTDLQPTERFAAVAEAKKKFTEKERQELKTLRKEAARSIRTLLTLTLACLEKRSEDKKCPAAAPAVTVRVGNSSPSSSSSWAGCFPGAATVFVKGRGPTKVADLAAGGGEEILVLDDEGSPFFDTLALMAVRQPEGGGLFRSIRLTSGKAIQLTVTHFVKTKRTSAGPVELLPAGEVQTGDFVFASSAETEGDGVGGNFEWQRVVEAWSSRQERSGLFAPIPLRGHSVVVDSVAVSPWGSLPLSERLVGQYPSSQGALFEFLRSVFLRPLFSLVGRQWGSNLGSFVWGDGSWMLRMNEWLESADGWLGGMRETACPGGQWVDNIMLLRRSWSKGKGGYVLRQLVTHKETSFSIGGNACQSHVVTCHI